MRLLLIEDISPQIMIALGERFDINPIFFAEYVNPTITDVDKDPLSQSLATLPSFKPSDGYLHLPYQQILDLSSAKISYDMKNALHTASNVPRDVEHFAFLSGQQLISAHATCSVIIEKFKTYSICTLNEGLLEIFADLSRSDLNRFSGDTRGQNYQSWKTTTLSCQ
ncbi:hypothetical protein FOC1_g10004613 [Fusarium oxysporum f. sp. cubense race 1]|uniref:Uncharacterized protein n=1 Tax=Fusarium oxysporum f. sp. cubense (strain race 1) TaxID=1229664 RepID=N4U6F2_FUSC1|nr:hypothetical protein FOC1_g10004613 [Fusarium oxysporum f. sp. cubense race 1]